MSEAWNYLLDLSLTVQLAVFLSANFTFLELRFYPWEALQLIQWVPRLIPLSFYYIHAEWKKGIALLRFLEKNSKNDMKIIKVELYFILYNSE